MDKSEIYRRALSATADVYGVTEKEIQEKSRKCQVVNARHMLQYVLQEYCGFRTKDMMEYAHSKSSYGHSNMQVKMRKDPYSAANCRYIISSIKNS